MKKRVLTALAVGLCIAANTFAQVPSYVPTNGLVGWWPFNGNANDESGNGNNGTLNGANLGLDRFNNVNSACNLDNQASDNVAIPSINFGNDFTISIWFKLNSYNQFQASTFFSQYNGNDGVELNYTTNTSILLYSLIGPESDITKRMYSLFSLGLGNWYHLVWKKSGNFSEFLLNGVSVYQQINLSNTTTNNGIGYFGKAQWGGNELSGLIDDVGIWNQALTQQEITALYQGCTVTASASPTAVITATGTNAQFSTTAISGASYQWQSNPANYGWSNVPNNASYTGGTSNTLTVSNVQLANHQQPFRVIATDGTCTDTSNAAYIQVADTCITNITVTDTLIINTTLSLPAPNNQNTILIYPNPASDHITIDNGNYAAMAGYSIKIENNAGQQVFQSAINQTQFYIDLNTWTGNGLYFVHLIDPSGTTVTIRKIVLQ
jgi:hypothetical protein